MPLSSSLSIFSREIESYAWIAKAGFGVSFCNGVSGMIESMFGVSVSGLWIIFGVMVSF